MLSRYLLHRKGRGILLASSLACFTGSLADNDALAKQLPDTGHVFPVPLSRVSAEAIRADIRFLADDLLEGRAPGTRGGELAANYIAAQFERLGLKPGGPNDSYFHPVTLVGITPRPSIVVGANRRTIALTYRDDFVAWPKNHESTVRVDGEIVFVGYGIDAPEWHWDDYKGASLHGKILLMLVNDPGLVDTTIFNGLSLTYYGRWTYKLEQAARMGALGAFLIHTEQAATYPWSVVRSSWTGEQIDLDRRNPETLRFAAWLSEKAARRILEITDRDYNLLVRRANQRVFFPIPVGAHASVDIRSSVRRFRSANVIARLDGNEPEGQREAVLFTAHYDHKGIGEPVNGDSIYNGAEDNASGVAALLSTAAAFASAERVPRRSVLFIATTAEEAGLLGARAYVADPVVPLEHTASVINVDRANLRGATDDIVALGAKHSSLGELLRGAAAAEGLSVSDDPAPNAGAFYRSDHFPFARAGVPVLSIRTGTLFRDRPSDWGEEQEREYNARRYHQPADEYRDDFSYEGLVQQVRLMVRIGWSLADSETFPSWTEDSEFRSAGLRLRGRRQRAPKDH